MTQRLIPVNTPILDGNEKNYLSQCIDTGWISSEGPYVTELEERFSACVGRRHGITVSNGTAALDIAVTSAGIGAGDEVILPTFTIISCAAAIIRAGAKPVLVDSDPYTWNMDPNQVESKVTPRTKAIMVVHIYGLPVDMSPILEIAEQHRLLIIEDAAEMLGQTYNERPCGSFGIISTFSFYPNKHLTTGEGGIVVTDSAHIAEKCRSLRNLCFQKDRRFYHEELGWNFRMSNIQAAVGVAQLERLDEFIARKRRMGAIYTELLQDLDWLQLPIPLTAYAQNIYWVYGLVIKEEIPYNADQIMKMLAEHGIDTRPFFWPMHQQPVFSKMGLYREERHPIAEWLGRKGFYIPSGLGLTDDQIQQVSSAMHNLRIT